VAAFAAALHAQSTKLIDVNEPRPLWRAIDKLETIVGLAINYEDVPYESAADVQDASTLQQQGTGPSFHFVAPRSGHVSAEIPMPSANAGAGEAIADVNRLLASYRENGLPGDFQVAQRDGVLYVTPTKTLGANGLMRAVTSPLAAPVKIPNTRRNFIETAEAIIDAVHQATGLRIVLGTFPYWPNQIVTFGVSGEPARDALARLLARMPAAPLSYRLIFEPRPDLRRDADYVLHIRRTGYGLPASPSAQ